MIRKFLSTDIAGERLQSRDTRFSLFDGRLLDAAGFLVDSNLFKELKSFDEITKAGHTIIVAEGGMGKSYVLQQFCKAQQGQSRITRLDLVSCVNDVQGLKDAVTDASLNKDYLFLDGLDEALDLVGLLARILQDVGNRVHVVIASRGIPQLKSLSDQLQWPMFSLLPYSRENVQELCLAADVEYDTFIRTVDRQNLGAICSKPLGCRMLILEYRKTALKGFTTEKLWRTSLESLCAENQESETREYVHDRPIVTVEEGIRIATIAALALKLSGNALLSRISDKPPTAGSVDSSCLFSNRDDRKAFNALLLRALFLYVDKDCYRFTHSSYEDFLAAQGVMEYLEEKEWSRIVFSSDGMPYPQWEGVIPWLAARCEEILEKTKRSRPDLLLGTDALVKQLGADEICQAILEHADQVSSSVRESPSVQSRYYALNTDKCAQVIRKILKTATSDEVIDTAIDIISRARLSSVADVLVEIFCDEARSRSLRISAGYTLVELANNSQRRMCKKVLQGPMADDLKGIVARMTWPNLMSVEELIALLDSKHGKGTDSFSNWLEYGGFVASLSHLNSKDKFKLLEWAVAGIKERDSVLDCIGDARRAVFLHCWKEERSPKFLPLLAKGIMAYDATFQSPFQNDDSDWHDSNHIFSVQDFCNDFLRRREIARLIVEKSLFPVDTVCSWWIRLLQSDDGDFVLTSLRTTSNPTSKERWAKCLLYMGYMQLPEKAQLWDQLHQEFPTVFTCNSEETLSESRKRENELAKMRLRFAHDQEKREKKNKCILSQNVAWAHEVLQKGSAIGKFVPLANVLIQQMQGDSAASFFDYRTSTLWVSLSEDERRNLLESAYDFLVKSKGPWSGSQKSYPIYSQALCLLFACGRDLLDQMSVKAWKKVAPELLHYLFEDFELIPSTILHFKEKHPRACLNVLLNYYKQQFRANDFWEIQKGRRFLSDTEFIRLLRLLDEDNLSDDLKYTLYGKFMKADYGLAACYVKNKYASVPLRNLEPRTIGCVLLAAPTRFPEFQRELTSDVAWGMHWAETLLSEETPHQARMAYLLPRLSIRDLTEFYSWLNIHFPPEKAPFHEGVFTPDATDNLYDFKSFVFKELMSRVEPEAVSAIEDLQRRFPNGNWFHDCALRLRNQLVGTKCPTFSMNTVCKLLENKKRMQVIHCADDLLQVIMDSLGRYQVYLTGVDAPQGRFLWNEHKGYVTHKNEEDVSDHLKAFLSKDLPSIVSNREVQLNRGRKGQKGSRTDIWIDAFADNMPKHLRLCIEVKGSWNQEVKTAFKTQLVEKYMDEGGANAGIFLVGWFESEREKKKTRIGKKDKIAQLLEEQEQGLVEKGYKVKHVILDCSSCLPPVAVKKCRNTRKRRNNA